MLHGFGRGAVLLLPQGQGPRAHGRGNLATIPAPMTSLAWIVVASVAGGVLSAAAAALALTLRAAWIPTLVSARSARLGLAFLEVPARLRARRPNTVAVSILGASVVFCSRLAVGASHEGMNERVQGWGHYQAAPQRDPVCEHPPSSRHLSPGRLTSTQLGSSPRSPSWPTISRGGGRFPPPAQSATEAQAFVLNCCLLRDAGGRRARPTLCRYRGRACARRGRREHGLRGGRRPIPACTAGPSARTLSHPC